MNPNNNNTQKKKTQKQPIPFHSQKSKAIHTSITTTTTDQDPSSSSSDHHVQIHPSLNSKSSSSQKNSPHNSNNQASHQQQEEQQAQLQQHPNHDEEVGSSSSSSSLSSRLNSTLPSNSSGRSSLRRNSKRKKSKNSSSGFGLRCAEEDKNQHHHCSESQQEFQKELFVNNNNDSKQQQGRNSNSGSKPKVGAGGHHHSILSPTHKQLLRRVQTKIETEDYTQDIKYRDLETNEQYDLKLNMKRTVINNMLEIYTEMNRRAQYLMKYIGFEIDKTCFYDTEVKKGYVLHEHIAEVKNELAENHGKRVPKDMFVKYPNDPSRSVSMCDTEGMSKLLDHILHSYISNYMVCPKCKSVKTTNPIVVDNDQQQNILNEFKENYNEELIETQQRQLIERLDDFTFFTIQCRDCGHIEKIENANTSDQFIKQIFQSRQRNMSKSLKHQQHQSNDSNVSHEQSSEFASNADYYPPMYGYPHDQHSHYYYMPSYYPTSNVLPPTPTTDVYRQGYYPQFYPNYYPYPYYIQPMYAITPPYINNNMNSASSEGSSSSLSSSSYRPVSDNGFNGGSSSFDSGGGGSSSAGLEFNPSYKAAGIIPYSLHNGKVYFLLGKENRGGKGDFVSNSGMSPPTTTEKESPYNVAKKILTWSEFGGKREKFDANPFHTASREFFEETRGLFGDIHEKIAPLPGKYYANGKYYVFMIELPFVDLEEDFANSTLVDSNTAKIEKLRLSWIDADDLIHRIYVHSSKYYHENGLLKLSVNGSDKDEFLHPFALALFRFMKTEVLQVMEKAKMNKQR